MALKDAFQQALKNTITEIQDDNVLIVRSANPGKVSKSHTIYDFLNRNVTMQVVGGSDTMIPFKHYDLETLENMRDFLVAAKKNPLPLPESLYDKPLENMPFTK